MAKFDWKVPQTQEGMQKLLAMIEEARGSADYRELGYGLMELANLVKWVPGVPNAFQESTRFGLEAISSFRHTDDRFGLAKALVRTVDMFDRAGTLARLAEAETIAAELGDQAVMAMVLAAKGRSLAASDPIQARAATEQALTSYRAIDDKVGQARCLFSLAITGDDSSTKFERAIEAAGLFEASGLLDDAARSLSIALMNAQRTQGLDVQEAVTQRGLKLAQTSGNRSLEQGSYKALARIATEKGDFESAHKYLRWHDELQDADGITPTERWKHNIEMTKMMISVAKAQKNPDMIKGFQDELKRLKSQKP